MLLRELLSCQIFQNAMDAIADPDNINHLIILWLDENEIISKTSDSRFDQLVPALKEFSSYVPPKPSEMVIYSNIASYKRNKISNIFIYFSESIPVSFFHIEEYPTFISTHAVFEARAHSQVPPIFFCRRYGIILSVYFKNISS